MRVKAVVFTFLTFLCFCLESTLLHGIALNGIVPNLSVAMIVVLSLTFGSTWGRRIGFMVGLFQDVLFLNVLGFYTLIFFLLGQGIGMLKEGFDQNNILFVIVITSISDFIYGFLSYLAIHFFQGRINLMYYLTHRILKEIVYTIPFVVLIFALVRLLDRIITHLADKHHHKRSFEMLPMKIRSE